MKLMKVKMHIFPVHILLKWVNTNEEFLNYLKNGIVPNQQDYVEQCTDKNQEYYKEQQFSQEKIKGTKLRLSNMYKGFVREIHGILFFRSQLTGLTCEYNTELDMKHGIDLLITYNNNKYGINLFRFSKKSEYYRTKKATRHDKILNVISKSLKLYPKDCKIFGKGKYELYDERYLPRLKTLIGYTE